QELLPGAVRFFEATRLRGQPVVVLTNNSTASVDQYVARLSRLGIPVERHQVITSAVAAARWLLDQGVRGPVLAIGEEGLLATLAEHGIPFCTGSCTGEPGADPARFQAVVVGLDTQFTYAKLHAACQAVRAGALFVGTNPDVTLPMEGGGLRPGCGSLLAAIAACSGVEPVVVGKPSPRIMEMALERLEATTPQSRQEVVVVGDRLDTDIEAAARLGLRSALVLSGVSSRADLERWPRRPHFVFNDLEELTRILVEA
ncbi:MAG TPA: HAD-IIA family hydrolase, partial [Limnochordales bacterium]